MLYVILSVSGFGTNSAALRNGASLTHFQGKAEDGGVVFAGRLYHSPKMKFLSICRPSGVMMLSG